MMQPSNKPGFLVAPLNPRLKNRASAERWPSNNITVTERRFRRFRKPLISWKLNFSLTEGKSIVRLFRSFWIFFKFRIIENPGDCRCWRVQTE